MAFDVIVGRDVSDKEKFGDRGLIFIGKGYVKMGNYTSLSNRILLDVARSHAILIAGKRGSGKSYTLSVIAEGLANLPHEEGKNIASLIFDTMGVFWTMKYENEKDKELLSEWGLKPKKIPARVFIPFGRAEHYDSKGLPYDGKIAIDCSELDSEDWFSIFNLNMLSYEGALIQKSISHLRKKGGRYQVKDIIERIKMDNESSVEMKAIVSNLFSSAENWGIFSLNDEGLEIQKIVSPGITSVIDLSNYSSTSSFNIRALIISIISRKLFDLRVNERKNEELEAIRSGQDYLLYNSNKESPLVWIFVDEAHEFLPQDGKTPATDSLIQILREGRQPGISLVLATQQPGKIHSDAMTQSDIVISHRLTSSGDLKALNSIMQNYLLEDITTQMGNLPSLKGSGLILEDNSERIYPMRVRPKFTWHGGESPSAVKAEIKI